MSRLIDADEGPTRLALIAIMGSLRDIEARGHTRIAVATSLRFHPDGSGHIEIERFEHIDRDPEVLFEFANVNQLAAWLAASSSQRTVIEAAERATRAERHRVDFAKLELLTAEVGRPC